MSGPRKANLNRVRDSYDRWLNQLMIWQRYRVGPNDRRTTPPPSFNVAELFPELAGRSTTTVRLHPRHGDEPPLDASKMGGTFIWPAEEPWPVCREHDIPLVTVLQLRAEEFREIPFPLGTDLFQVLWCPREHDESEFKDCPMYWADPKFFWRNRKEIRHLRADNPLPRDAYYEYVPLPCRLLPERILEYPSVYDLPEDLVDRIRDWEDRNLTPKGVHACEYGAELSVCNGTKVGGYLHWIQFPWIPTCKCGEGMDHLLTIGTTEWDGILDRRWTPLEEQEILRSFPGKWDELTQEHKDIFHALWIPTGLSLGDGGHMQLFVCRRCPDRPIVPAIECC